MLLHGLSHRGVGGFLELIHLARRRSHPTGGIMDQERDGLTIVGGDDGVDVKPTTQGGVHGEVDVASI